MKVCSIASSSKGNAYYLETLGNGFLIDAGISFKRIREGLEKIDRDINNIKGIFITHEHSDHVKGIEMIAKKTDMKLYSSEGTLEELKKMYPVIEEDRCCILEKDRFSDIEGLMVEPFSIFHDAKDPVGYLFQSGFKQLGLLTDTGKISEKIVETLFDVNAVILEANYDNQMLVTGKYPRFLKERIKSDEGHLSNFAAADFLKQIIGNKLEYVFLAHLSEENNLPYIALESVEEYLKGHNLKIDFNLDCLSRTMNGPLISF